MDMDSHIWFFIFCYLNSSDIARVSVTCLAWWNLVFGKKTIRFRRILEQCEELNISRLGSTYTRLPLQIFRGLLSHDIGSTEVTSNHLLKIVKLADLQYLDVSNCPRLEDEFIFRVKNSLGELAQLDISHNSNISILGLACLCSYSELQLIYFHGMKLNHNQMLFLSKTFNTVSRGECEIETEDGEYPLRLYREFEEELIVDF